MRRILCVLGTRPEIVKLAPVIHSLVRMQNIEFTLVHSGQHYDAEMSQYFLTQLALPRPDVNLGVGAGSHAYQTAHMILACERAISRKRPDMVLAEGDTNTVLAAALASIKTKTCFGHVEAGLRCFDRSMPEEVNRTIADDCAQLCFAPTTRSAHNLLREGISPHRIFVTGNPIVEACKTHLQIAQSQSRILDTLGLSKRKRLLLVTAHREENTDNPQRLKRIVKALTGLNEFQIVYPIHPRTRRKLSEYRLFEILRAAEHVMVTKPLGYWDFLRLLDASALVITDSGGVQEESLTLGVPCLTLRYCTERPETIEAGGNVLVGTKVELIVHEALRLSSDSKLRKRLCSSGNPLGDGRAGHRIANICARLSQGSFKIQCPNYMKDGAAYFRLIPVRKERTVEWLETKHPSVVVTQAYETDGTPIFPRSNLRIRKGWHLQAFGQPSDLIQLASRCS